MTCPLCKNTQTSVIESGNSIKLYKCETCHLIHKDIAHHLNSEEEKERYQEHNNTKDCPGYVENLSKAYNPTIENLRPEMIGLDYGCGPTTVLSQILTEKGYPCQYYDPLFHPELPHERMDYIIATECFEHFKNPAMEMSLITALLIPGGNLTIMTQFWDDTTDLNNWWYSNDPTHITFYHLKTFEYIAKRFGYSQLFSDQEKVIILKKNIAQIDD